MSAETLDDYLAPLGAPEWASLVEVGDKYPDHIDRDTYTLPDDDAADWAIRKLAKAKADIEQAERMADERKKLIDRWLQDSTASDRQTVEFFTGLLGEYHSRVLADDPDRKTLDLPSGRVKSRTSKPAVEIADKAAIVEWAEAHGIVEWQPKVLVSQVRKHAEVAGDQVVDPDTGEVVDGLSVRPGRTSFTVDPS